MQTVGAQIRALNHSSHRWQPEGQPIIGLNPDPNAPACERFVTLTDVVYSHSIVKLRIEKGFKCDLASIPRWAWWLTGFAPTDTSARAALVHDYLYRNLVVGRAVADGLFVSALEFDGWSGWRLDLMERGVRRGGRKVYQRYLDEAKKNEIML